MTERLLQYIWQFQFLKTADLKTAQGQGIQILAQGTYNTNQGPDFLNARIKIDDTTWVGNVELHVKTSEWKLHQHSTDSNYNNVILHVVWEDDTDLQLAFPTVEIKEHVPKMLLEKYELLMNDQSFIPCEKQLSHINELVLSKWIERLVVERLEQKVAYISKLLGMSKNFWPEVFWWMLARNFGSKVNNDAFENIAQTLPTTLLSRHKSQLIHLEALLLGQAGLLNARFNESYPDMLQREYLFLKKKYGLKEAKIPVHFLRMRPANFPTLRLAQLAAVIQQSDHLFDTIKTVDDLSAVKKLFNVVANDYWHYHYTFDDPGNFKIKATGKDMIRNIIINTVIPMLYAYGEINDLEPYKLKALRWLEETEAEHNNITDSYQSLGIKNKSAFDSQALLQLKKEYCDQRKCLQCSIRNGILKGV